MARIETSMQAIQTMPISPQPELIPESVETQLPTGARVRFCFDEPLMTSDAGLLLVAG